jgi:hypothetical protein
MLDKSSEAYGETGYKWSNHLFYTPGISMYRIMVVDIMVPTHSVIRSHKKKIESSPSMIFPQGMVTTKVLPSAHTISILQQ